MSPPTSDETKEALSINTGKLLFNFAGRTFQLCLDSYAILETPVLNCLCCIEDHLIGPFIDAPAIADHMGAKFRRAVRWVGLVQTSRIPILFV